MEAPVPAAHLYGCAGELTSARDIPARSCVPCRCGVERRLQQGSPAHVKMADWGPAFLPPSPPTPCASCPQLPDVLREGLGLGQQHKGTTPTPHLRRQNGPQWPIWAPKSYQSMHAPPAAIGAPPRALPWKPDGMQVPCRVPLAMLGSAMAPPSLLSNLRSDCCARANAPTNRLWSGCLHLHTRGTQD